MKRTPMTRRTPMKRTAWGKATPEKPEDDREARLEARAARAMACATPSPDNVTMAANDQMFVAPIEKENPLKSERYRRLVAAMPCAHCGAVGWSQHAHENVGKGAGWKVDDRRAMPLCCTRPGVEGCHVAFDQYRLFEGGREAHREAGKEWARKTRHAIKASGEWPPSVPEWIE